MNRQIQFPAQLKAARHLLKWTLLVLPLSVVTGSLTALFLWALDKATCLRWQQNRLLWLLPLAGIAIYFLYRVLGKNAEGGNNLILQAISKPGGNVPLRMAPLVILTTLLTHLFGGSAGREGTAVQVGGSIAAYISRKLKLEVADTRILLMAGIAAGFGGVFGTPVAGALFALEVIAIGRMRYEALLPCLMAGVLADVVVSGWGIHHTHYAISSRAVPETFLSFIRFDWLLLAKVIAAGIGFGLAANGFSWLTHNIKLYSKRLIKPQWLIPFIGGCIIIALTYAIGSKDYLGLGVASPSPNGASIANAFHAGGVTSFSWLWKMLFTTITLGTGFKGGEVTPLFFIGAALGNVLAVVFGVPVDLLAGLGFIAVFAGTTNTPVASTIMGVELFGGEYFLYYAVACFTAYYFSGHSGIYAAQFVAVDKHTGLSFSSTKQSEGHPEEQYL